MSKPIFIDGVTRLCASILQPIADAVWDALGTPTTPTEARENIGAMPTAPATNRFYLGQDDRWIELTSSGGANVSLTLGEVQLVQLTDFDLDWSDPNRLPGELPALDGLIDGVNDTFDLRLNLPGSNYPTASPNSAEQLRLYVNDAIQQPIIDYTVSGDTVTFTTPPPADADIWGIYYEAVDFENLIRTTAVRLLYVMTGGETQIDIKEQDIFGNSYTLRDDPKEPVNLYINGELQRWDDGTQGVGFLVDYPNSFVIFAAPANPGDEIVVEVLSIAAGKLEILRLRDFDVDWDGSVTGTPGTSGVIDGTRTDFLMVRVDNGDTAVPFTAEEVALFVDDERLIPVDEFTVSGDILSFATAPQPGQEVWALWNKPLGDPLQLSDIPDDFYDIRLKPSDSSVLQGRVNGPFLGPDENWVDLVDLENSLVAEDIPSNYSPTNYTPVGGTSVRDHLEGIDQSLIGDDLVEGVVFVTPNGDDANSGESHRAGVATFERAAELADTISGRTLVLVYPNPAGYTTEGEIAWPDHTSVVGYGKARATPIRPVDSSDLYSERNVFLMGNGFYANGLSFEGWRIDNLADPTKGFAVAFRPGALIQRLPYIVDSVVYRPQDPGLVPPPQDRDNSNPLVLRGGGVVLADASIISQYSIPQVMTWGFTPSSPNGIGYCVKNGAFVNPINAIGLWCQKNMMAMSGGRIQASSCATQFGDWSFWAEGSTDVVDPVTTAGPVAVDAALAAAIEAQAQAIIDAMWLDLVANYSSNPAAQDEASTKRDAALFLLALRYCYASGRSESMENFTRGLFDYKGDYVFDVAMLAPFKDSFLFMATEVKDLTNNVTSEAMADGLVAALNATLDNPVKRREPSYINAVAHQMNLPGSGVTLAALPTLFGYQGEALTMDQTVFTDGVGVVDYSASDDGGTTRWMGGARIDGRTGELGGPPVDAYVRRQIAKGVVAATGF